MWEGAERSESALRFGGYLVERTWRRHMKIDHHEIRLTLDPSGRPLAGSRTTVLDDGGYVVDPVEFGPFDDWDDALQVLGRGLDIQLTLW